MTMQPATGPGRKSLEELANALNFAHLENVTLSTLLTLVSAQTGSSARQVLSKDQTAQTTYSRYLCIYFLTHFYNWGPTRIGHVLGRHHTSVTSGLEELERRRTARRYDDSLSHPDVEKDIQAITTKLNEL